MGYRIFTLATFVLLLISLPASGTETLTEDATWWNSLEEANQLAAVQAALDAYETGFVDGALNFQGTFYHLALKQPLSQREATLLGNLGLSAAKQTVNSSPGFPSTFGTYVHGISDFYANHPEAARASIGDILSCLAARAIRTCDSVAQASAKNGSQ